MGQTNGNRPKVDLQLGQEARYRIVRPVSIGQNSYGKFYLYAVQDLDDGETKSFFAPEQIHQIIEEHKLGVGSEFLLKKIGNGKGSKLELSILGKADQPAQEKEDNLKEILLRCVLDASEVVKESGIQFSLEETQKLAGTLFIARTKQW